MKNINPVMENYRKSVRFIKESRDFIYVAVLFFLTFFLIGFLLPVPSYIADQITALLQELMEKTGDMSQFELTKFIFFNNMQSSFFAMAFGILFGIFSIFVMITNGYLVGVVSSLSVEIDGILSLWRLFPHGIFELPAVFISAGLGLKIGSFIFQKKKFKSLKDYTINSLRAFVFVIIPLLVIAAIIEGALIFLSR